MLQEKGRKENIYYIKITYKIKINIQIIELLKSLIEHK